MNFFWRRGGITSREKDFRIKLTRKGTQMINSDLIQTLVIDRPNIRMNNGEKIIGAISL